VLHKFQGKYKGQDNPRLRVKAKIQDNQYKVEAKVTDAKTNVKNVEKIDEKTNVKNVEKIDEKIAEKIDVEIRVVDNNLLNNRAEVNKAVECNNLLNNKAVECNNLLNNKAVECNNLLNNKVAVNKAVIVADTEEDNSNNL
jgi:hypothetical protein